MNILSWNTQRVLPGLLLLVAAATCQAGSIQLTPVRINLSDTAKVAVLTVRNTGTEESVMQVTLNKWTLDGQSYAYNRSQELVVTPVTFRLAAGGQQIVRIGLRGSAPVDREASYRLLIEEVPPPPSSDVTQTRLVVRHDLPVFVAPTQASMAALDVAVECTAHGAKLSLNNIGNVHTQLRSIALEGVPGKEMLGHWDTFDYLLPDAQKSWDMATVAPESTGKTFLVTALTDQGSFAVDVKNTCN